MKKKESKYKNELRRTVYFKNEVERDAFINLSKKMRLTTGDTIIHLMVKSRYDVPKISFLNQ